MADLICRSDTSSVVSQPSSPEPNSQPGTSEGILTAGAAGGGTEVDMVIPTRCDCPGAQSTVVDHVQANSDPATRVRQRLT